MKKSIEEINKKIRSGTAIVMSASEICDYVRFGKEVGIEDVDVVTTATRGLMSGTFVIFSIKITERNVFRKAKKILLNGVPAYAGPCPNERLGMVECIVYGTEHSEENPEEYGGGHLFRDILEDKPIQIYIETAEGKEIKKEINKSDIEFAKLVATRNAFKNYMAFTNKFSDSVKTIFHIKEFPGPLKEISVCGCGEINPIEKDPSLSTIAIGTRILVNGAIGYIMDKGTRSSKDKPNISLFSNFLEMDPRLMGGFITSGGPEVINTIAIPIPIINESILESVKKIDKDTKLPIAEIHDRIPFMYSSYDKIWQNNKLIIEYDPKACDQPISMCVPWSEINQRRRPCIILDLCPMKSYIDHKENIFDLSNCFHCGICVQCPKNAFKANLGTIEIDNTEVPITLRQSDKYTSVQQCNYLKEMILKGKFLLSDPLEKIKY
ncbi:MAG: methanogenesis marker 16 metalloprotein [Candidatus Thorarchaeota archaeon]